MIFSQQTHDAPHNWEEEEQREQLAGIAAINTGGSIKLTVGERTRRRR